MSLDQAAGPKKRAILAGLGVMGNYYLGKLRASPQCDWIAGVEPDPALRRRRSEEHGINPQRLYPTLDDALQDVGAADILVDVTPPMARAANCLRAAEAGMHILAEKPLADNLAAAQRMVAAAERSGVLLMVAQQRRFTPVIQTLRAAVARCARASLRQVHVNFHHLMHRDSWRDTMRHPLLIEMSGHHFDAIRCVLGREPESVQGMAWNPSGSRFRGDCACALLFRYADGLTVCYQANWAASDAAKTSNECDWRFDFTDRALVARQDEVFTAMLGHEPQREAPVPMASIGHDRILSDFWRAIAGMGGPETSGRDNLGTLRMVFAAVEAVESGKLVRVEREEPSLAAGRS